MSDAALATKERTNRRLAAILAADVVGYSKMMSKDETGTLAALKRHREGLFDPLVVSHNGRIVKLIGDGTLVEFGSVVDAVRCALAIQTAPRDGANAAPIVLRIGVNLGDIIIEGDDIYGDGVNIAARLEPLAEPGGICIASIVHESVGNRLEIPFADGGEVSVKNIDRPIRVWRWHPSSSAAVAAARAVAQAGSANGARSGGGGGPSIAVLPFANMSGDAEQEYFSDGITEDIITDLSKIGGLKVIARNSTFVFKGKSVDIRTVGRELGVKSVLEGSIRRAGNRVRITAQLIEADSGSHLWAERYDRDLTDIFAVQDDVTRQIVGALKVALTPQEKTKLTAGLGGTGTSHPEAFDYLLRAREMLLRPTKNRSVFKDAVDLLERAIALDPDYADAYAGLGMAYNLDYQNRWSDSPDKSLGRGIEYGEIAARKEPDNPFAHTVVGMMATFNRDLAVGARETDIALKLSPNNPMALNARGVVQIYSGNAADAVPDIENAMRLDPGFSHQYLHFLGVAHLMLRHYETAIAHFRARIAQVPETDLSRGMLIVALGYLGHTEEAAKVWDELKAINPHYSFAKHLGRLPFRKQADVDYLHAGFAKSGIVEQAS
jgi:adenylate cyclase